MKKTLYWKFLVGYLFFAFFGFLVVANFVSGMTFDHLKKERADALYKEAVIISESFASDLYSSNTSMETVKTRGKPLVSTHRFNTAPYASLSRGENGS